MSGSSALLSRINPFHSMLRIARLGATAFLIRMYLMFENVSEKMYPVNKLTYADFLSMIFLK
jgi:hypothetical protein